MKTEHQKLTIFDESGADANWKSFEQQLKDAGLDQMMAVIQSAYDRYLVTYDTYAEMMK